MITNNKVLCFGEVLWDMLPTGAKAGGAPMNVALHLHKIGAEVGLVAKVGDDKLGNDLIRFIDTFGLNPSMVQVDDNLPTSQVLVHLDKDKNATYEICEDVAWDTIIISDSNRQFAQEASVFVYGSLASRFEKTRATLLDLLAASSAYKVMDVNLRPPYIEQGIIELLLSKADLAKVNDDELYLIAKNNGVEGDEETLMKWMADFFDCETICVTKGAAGAILYMNNEFVSHPGFKIQLADSVGAGDAFLGGLISAIIQGEEPKEAITYACAVGAYVASKEGATPEYNAEEIDAIMT
jgi:fructokinase